MMASQPYPDERTWWRDFDKAVAARYDVVHRPWPDPNDPDTFVWRGRTAFDIADGLTKEASAAKHLLELEAQLGINQPPPGTPTNRPLVGPLRVENKLFLDDTGYRRVFFCSWFPALRILRDNPTEFYRQLDAIAAAGYQGIRIFLAVGGWMPYWDGKEVVPIRFQKASFQDNHLRPVFNGPWLEAWPDYDDLLRTLLRACGARKLRLHVTTGDMQIIDRDGSQEIALHQRLSRICAEEGGTNVIAVAEVTNEFPLNRYGGESPESIAQMGLVIDVWQAAIPGVITGQGAIPGNEEIASLDKASTHGTVCIVHVTRDPIAKAFKRVFGLIYQEGNYRKYPKAFWEGEHIGPGADSYQRCDDPSSLVGCYAAHAITGQGSVRFQGAAVRFTAPLESEWGFTELPALFATHLPEDIATWAHGSDQHGGIEYWWKGNDFRTFTHAEWNNAPPRPIATWTCYPSGQHGTGTPSAVTGLLVGTFT